MKVYLDLSGNEFMCIKSIFQRHLDGMTIGIFTQFYFAYGWQLYSKICLN